MAAPVLATKLFIPPLRRDLVLRQRLIDQLNVGVQQKLTLISAPAGFGKTTLVSEWTTICGQPVAWLSLDEGDNDPTRFLAYVVAALQAIAPKIGAGALAALQSSQPPPIESILTALLNEITTLTDHFSLVLDDYHVIDSKTVDNALTFLLEHFPPQSDAFLCPCHDAKFSKEGQVLDGPPPRALDIYDEFRLSEDGHVEIFFKAG